MAAPKNYTVAQMEKMEGFSQMVDEIRAEFPVMRLRYAREQAARRMFHRKMSQLGDVRKETPAGMEEL